MAILYYRSERYSTPSNQRGKAYRVSLSDILTASQAEAAGCYAVGSTKELCGVGAGESGVTLKAS